MFPKPLNLKLMSSFPISGFRLVNYFYVLSKQDVLLRVAVCVLQVKENTSAIYHNISMQIMLPVEYNNKALYLHCSWLIRNSRETSMIRRSLVEGFS